MVFYHLENGDMDKALNINNTFHKIKFKGELYQSKNDFKNIKFTVNVYLNYKLTKDEDKARNLAWKQLYPVLEENFRHNPNSRCWSEHIDIVELNEKEKSQLKGESKDFNYSDFKIQIEKKTTLAHSFVFGERHLKAKMEDDDGIFREKSICVYINIWVDSKFCPDFTKAQTLAMELAENDIQKSFKSFIPSNNSYCFCDYLGLVEKKIPNNIARNSINIISEENLFSRLTYFIDDIKEYGWAMALKHFCASFRF
jgi:hypothetical protein